MRHIASAILLLLCSSQVCSAQSLKDCFEDQEDHSRISICVTKVYAEREAIRDIIEKEFETFILDDKYITPPIGYNQEDKFKFKPNLASGPKPQPNSAPFDPNKNNVKHTGLDKKMIEIQNQIDKQKQKAAQAKYRRELEKQKIDFALEQSQKKQSLFKEKSAYERRKREALSSLQASRMAYEAYKESECKRQSDVHGMNADSYLKDITLKTCYYDMTNHRIKTLQRSMER